jgi:hypothetical protein
MEGGAVGHKFERDPPRGHPCQAWFSGFRGEDLNVIFYQNMPYLHNRYKSAERKFHRKTKMSSNFNCSYMGRSSLTYSPFFSVSRFIPIIQIRHILK